MELPLEKFGEFEIKNKKYINRFIARFNYTNKVNPCKDYLMIINDGETDEGNIKKLKEALIHAIKTNRETLPVKKGLIKDFKDLLKLNINHCCNPDYIYTNGQKVATLVKRDYGFEFFLHINFLDFFCSFFPVISLELDTFKEFKTLEEGETYIEKIFSSAECKEILVFKGDLEKKILIYPWFREGNIIHFEKKYFYEPCIEYEEPYRTLNNLSEKLDGYSTKSCGTCFYFAFSGMSRDMSGGLKGYCERYSKKWGDSNTIVDVFDLCEGFKFIRDIDRKSPYIEENYEKKMELQTERIFRQAIQSETTDIHIEVKDWNVISIRYRIKGVLQEGRTEDISYSFVYHIKTMAKFDMVESGVPQDGEIQFKHNNKEYGFLLSFIPTVQGEKIVIKIIKKTSFLPEFDKMGFLPDTEALLKKLLSFSRGLIIVTGNHAEIGMTTTLYTALTILNSPKKNISTAEETVKYHIEGINQVELKDLSRSEVLGALLRQDSDVIMIDFLRGSGLTEMAMEAAKNSLVLTGLYSDDTASVIPGFTGIGIPPFLVVSSLKGVIAQCLVKVICSDCRQPYVPPEDLLVRAGLKDGENILFYKGSGCKNCNNSGYKGRTGIFEILIVDEDIRSLILKNASSKEIKGRAIKNGMVTLQKDCLRKVLKGITTVEEYLRLFGDF